MKFLKIVFLSLLIQFPLTAHSITCKIWSNADLVREAIPEGKFSTNSIYTAAKIKQALLDKGYQNVDIISLAERDKVRKGHHGLYAVVSCQ